MTQGERNLFFYFIFWGKSRRTEQSIVHFTESQRNCIHYGGDRHHLANTICQCNNPTRTKENKLSHATSIGNKRKQTEDRKTFFISNIVSIVSYPSKKTYHNEVNAILDLLQCSRSSAYLQQRKASTKRGHLIAQVKSSSVKWSIKTCIVRTKKISKALRKETVDWIMKNSNVRQSSITRDTLLIADADTKVKCRVPYQG